MDPHSEARLQLVHPVLADKVRQMAATLLQEGIEIRVVQGLRTYQEQAALYAQGRTAPGSIVTNAKPGFSYHNAGLAVDCIPGVRGSNPWQPDWTDRVHGQLTPDYARMVQVGKSLGLVSGADFASITDDPHFQMTGSFPIGCPPEPARDLMAQNDLKGVWAMAGLAVS
jgi:peptidoglycan L-alanyl-D-glutamate endopeptidase CwlK